MKKKIYFLFLGVYLISLVSASHLDGCANEYHVTYQGQTASARACSDILVDGDYYQRGDQIRFYCDSGTHAFLSNFFPTCDIFTGNCPGTQSVSLDYVYTLNDDVDYIAYTCMHRIVRTDGTILMATSTRYLFDLYVPECAVTRFEPRCEGTHRIICDPATSTIEDIGPAAVCGAGQNNPPQNDPQDDPNDDSQSPPVSSGGIFSFIQFILDFIRDLFSSFGLGSLSGNSGRDGGGGQALKVIR